MVSELESLHIGFFLPDLDEDSGGDVAELYEDQRREIVVLVQVGIVEPWESLHHVNSQVVIVEP